MPSEHTQLCRLPVINMVFFYSFIHYMDDLNVDVVVGDGGWRNNGCINSARHWIFSFILVNKYEQKKRQFSMIKLRVNAFFVLWIVRIFFFGERDYIYFFCNKLSFCFVWSHPTELKLETLKNKIPSLYLENDGQWKFFCKCINSLCIHISHFTFFLHFYAENWIKIFELWKLHEQ